MNWSPEACKMSDLSKGGEVVMPRKRPYAVLRLFVSIIVIYVSFCFTDADADDYSSWVPKDGGLSVL